MKKDSDEKDSKESEQEIRLKSSLEIKTRFLKQHIKEHYYQWGSSDRSERVHKIHTIRYLRDALKECLDRWAQLIKQLHELLNRPEERQARHAEFALIILGFKKRQNFNFIADFVGLSQDKSSDELHKTLELLIGELKASLDQCEQLYLPSQTSGVAIARASFNYYTINKKPRDYPKEISNKRDELDQKMEDDKKIIAAKIGVSDTNLIAISSSNEFFLNQAIPSP